MGREPVGGQLDSWAMKVYVEPTGRRIHPFDDAAGDTPILGRPLRDWLQQAFREAGLTVISELQAPCLVVPDNLFTTGKALREFVDTAAGRDAVLVLGDSVFARSTTPVQPGVSQVALGWRFDRIRWVSGQAREPVEVVVDPQERTVNYELPEYYLGVDKFELGFTTKPVMTLHHWVHVLWANQNAAAAQILATPKWRWLLTGTSALLRAVPFLPSRAFKSRVMGNMVSIGKGCDIHPSAVVEGSIIGDGVKIGPHARVRFSMLGAGTSIMNGADVEFCSIGERSIVSQHCVMRQCVFYPEAVGGQYLMQFCVLGRRCVTTSGAFSMDLNFEGPVRVMLDGELHSTGQSMIGAAFGHRSRIGTGLWLAAGRAIPNDYFVIRAPEGVLSKIPDGLADQGPLYNEQGVLVALKSRK